MTPDDNKKLDWGFLGQRKKESFSFFTINEVQLKHPKTGARRTFHQLKTRDWVNVFAFTNQQTLVLVELFRFGTLKRSLETPGGVVEDGEPSEQAAKRELLEETGYAPGKVSRFGSLHPNPAVNTNSIHFYLATGLEYRGQEPDPDEVIRVRTMTLQEFERRILSGNVLHSLVVGGYFLLKEHLRKEEKKGNVLLPKPFDLGRKTIRD